MGLNAKQLAVLRREIISTLTGINAPLPFEGEAEPAYTGRVLFPALEELSSDLHHPGLTLRSDGMESPDYVTVGKLRFTPDMSFSHNLEREIAIECKFVSPNNINNPLATAIGQGTIYKTCGYKRSILVLVEKKRVFGLGEEEVDTLSFALQKADIDVVIIRGNGSNNP